ncbi:hypothetical protein PMAYCL1PPCAC_07530, partial [Pristionchus mayeri]
HPCISTWLSLQVMSMIIEAQAPCHYDLPYTNTFPIFCQLNYHGASYLCDPAGLMSRTEVDLLADSVSSLNLTTAFCQPHCGTRKLRVAVVLEDVASLHGLQSCSQSIPPLHPFSARPPALIPAALEFARLLNEHWDEAAPADLLIVLIKLEENERLKQTNSADPSILHTFIDPSLSRTSLVVSLTYLASPSAFSSTRDSLISRH